MTQTSNAIKYRIATSNDETDMYVMEEVAPEIPVSLDTEDNQIIMRGIITECRGSGKSWVAIDANGVLVGCVLRDRAFMSPVLSLCLMSEKSL
jgi:hypothetical protein